ncbi:MAG: LamG domain-containing protein, partial [Candidatus Hydrogenedentes bacterium]|nr:LamG domain-containing protein [Candidatus Hydrogenedentota bacterium]
EEPVITKGAFDSQNLAFYDNVRGRYVDFHRGFKDGVRHIMTCTSEDFQNWTEPQWVDFGDTPDEHLYTNATIAYPRAPHIFMAFPKRFVPGRDSGVHPIPGVSDGVFMTSRDGNHWNRWREAFIRPGAQDSRWVNRNNMTAWGMLQTAAFLPDTPDEYSLYSTEGYYVGPCRLRRFTIRQDGFVSVHAGGEKGEFITKPLIFSDDPKVTVAPATRKRVVLTDAAINGKQSLRFDRAETITMPNTQSLGAQATFAAVVRDVPKGGRRLFSAYNGGAVTTTQGEMWIDFDSSGKKTGMRFGCEGELIEADPEKLVDWSKGSGDSDPHLLVATWDDGVVTLYFDGKIVGQGGTAGRGALNFAHGDVLFGEDYAPAARGNEPFLGVVDDILILRRALSPAAVAALAERGADSLTGDEGDLRIDFETDDEGRVLNAFNKSEVISLPGYQGPADTVLSLNYATSAAGSIRCEIQDADGTPIPGYTLADCDEIFGDQIAHPVSWGGRAEVNSLVGKPVRLRFVMFDADLYSLRFQ